MKTVNVGLIGFGTIGKGVVKTFLTKKKVLEERAGVSINLVKIADKDLRPRRGVHVPKKLLTKNIDAIIKDKSIDIVIELMGGIHPAKEVILRSLTLGKHVVTANKALIAEHGKEIFTVASKFRSSVGFEASVGGGIPVINALSRGLVANDIESIYGILNGTSNFILTKMSEEECDFKAALKDAQDKGLAEKNPTLDISGGDSSHKLAILALLGFGINVKPKSIFIEGIENVDASDIEYAKNWGYAVKLLAIAKKRGHELDLRVHPTLISLKNILASVKYEDNAIFIIGDMVGESLFYGKGAGSFPTASAVVSDVIRIAKSMDDYRKTKESFKLEFKSGVKKVRKMNDLLSRYYLRFSAVDKPGVLAKVSKILAENNISIATVSQKERKMGQVVPLVMLTHHANEGKMNRALKKIDKLSFISGKTVKIRIERL